MKKLATLLAVMLLATGLTACGKSEADVQKDGIKKFFDAPIERKGY